MIISLTFILALIFFILALVLTKKNKTNFVIGILIEISAVLLSSGIYMIYFDTDITNVITFLIKDFMQYITYIIAILFIYNGVYNSITPQKIRKNNITDLLSFLAGITLIMLNILTHKKEGIIFDIVDILLLYIDVMFIAYVIMSITYKLLLKKKEYNILIVLGCGLIEGIRPSRTLIKRLEKAIKVYNSLNKEKETYFIVSGGKGADEKISEAEAMQKYLIDHGIDKDKIILEDKSTNTYENLKYTKEIIQKELNIKNKEIAIITSDFHIYRTAIYSKNVGMESNVIGAKTLFYYYPNAFIREFAAIIVKYKYGILYYLPFAIIFLKMLLTK